jgi:hypothetical protein
MKKRDRKALGGYIRDLADKLYLRDWTFHIDHVPCNEDFLASIECAKHQHEATISLAADFRDREPEIQRETIIHELLHVHHENCWRMIQTDLKEPLGKVAYYIFCDAYRANMELAIDSMNKAIALHMPFIEWPK